MKTILLSFAILVPVVSFAQELYTPHGIRVLKNKSFDNSESARKEILDLYRDLRVTDVLDGMDLIGLQDIGLMNNDIRPLWRDVDQYTHRIVGFAVTVRFVPADVRVGTNSFENIESAKKWKLDQRKRFPDSGWSSSGKKGDVVVMDVNDVFECGNIGSNNSLKWAYDGFVGVITNGGARDTDEIIKTRRMPVYCRDGYPARGVKAGRLVLESYNFPINCAGVLVYPGDLIVADGDGVIVVPREHALKVGSIAREIMINDQKSRALKYNVLGIPPDATVEPYLEK